MREGWGVYIWYQERWHLAAIFLHQEWAQNYATAWVAPVSPRCKVEQVTAD